MVTIELLWLQKSEPGIAVSKCKKKTISQGALVAQLIKRQFPITDLPLGIV